MTAPQGDDFSKKWGTVSPPFLAVYYPLGLDGFTKKCTKNVQKSH
jgi:hypothetical protein